VRLCTLAYAGQGSVSTAAPAEICDVARKSAHTEVPRRIGQRSASVCVVVTTSVLWGVMLRKNEPVCGTYAQVHGAVVGLNAPASVRLYVDHTARCKRKR